MLEGIAEWYLKRRGRIVLGRRFEGIAVGNATMIQQDAGAWTVLPNGPNPQIIALNHSYVRTVK